MDVDTRFDIASLDDWVPKAAGRFNGKFHVAGTWPRLAINGKAEGRDLAYGEYSLKAIDVDADVQNPQSPSGSTKISASTIIAAGFEFSKVDLDASGDEKAHTVHLESHRLSRSARRSTCKVLALARTAGRARSTSSISPSLASRRSRCASR